MPKKFDKSFKINAVDLVKRQGLSVVRVSHDLGIGLSTLERWIRELKVEGVENAFPGSGHLKLQDGQVRRLERENEVLRREQDILKNSHKDRSFPVL